MSKLLESALWYLEKWNVNPVFCNVYKKPLHSWSELYGAKLTRAEVEKLYASVEKPAGIAVLPSAESRVVVLDLDLYRAGVFDTARIAESLASSGFIVATTPRGGLRVVFSAPDRSNLPGRLAVYWHDTKIGEGAGLHKHLWHMPPSVACVDDQCTKKSQYLFVLPGGGSCKYPWELPWETPLVHEVGDAFSVIESLVGGIRIEAESGAAEKASGVLKLSTAQVAPKPTIPCWLDLKDFEAWLSGLRPPAIALPACVARALGYYTTSDGRNIPGAGKVPRGLRFTLGALAVMFLVATIADAKPEEIIDFVGKNLEDYPQDEGEPLNTRFSRLIVVYNGHAYPRYSGLGAIGTTVPTELCKNCNYALRCRVSTKRTNRFIVWQAFSEAFWSALPKQYVHYYN